MYTPTTAAYCLEVERTAVQAIKDNLRRWRSKRLRSTTTFHPDACSALNDLLPMLEDWKRTGVLPSSSAADQAGSASGKSLGLLILTCTGDMPIAHDESPCMCGAFAVFRAVMQMC
jgi:hypothetical protein